MNAVLAASALHELAANIPLLTLLVGIPTLGAIAAIVAGATRASDRTAKMIGVGTSLLTLLLGVLLVVGFDRHNGDYQFLSSHQWIPALGISWKLGVDGISLFLVALTTLVFPLVFLGPRVAENLKSYVGWMLLLEAGCIGAFLALDLFLFFVFFEVVLVPMYFLIAGWGHERRRYVALKFFLYTLAGSAFLFVGMIAVVFVTATTSNAAPTFDFVALQAAQGFTDTQGLWLFVAFAIAFAVKVPVFPVHTWLPDTYRHAPIAAVIISAGVMVKLGTYGFVRFGVQLFPEAARELAPVLLTLALIGMIYGAIVAAVQHDLRRLLAYSSLSHLGFIVLGTFAFSDIALSGAVIQMVNHGIYSVALFLLLGMIYARRGTTEISQLRGIQKAAPVMAAIFTVMMMASIGVPGLNGFVGEFLILLGTFETHRWWAVVGTAAVVLSAIYLLWAYQRTFHLEPDAENAKISDITWPERMLLAPLVVLVVFLGVYPQPVLDRIEPSVDRILASTPAPALPPVDVNAAPENGR